MQLPESFITEIKNLLGATEYEKFNNSYNNPPLRALRINKLKTSVFYNDLQGVGLPKVQDIQWCKEGYTYSEDMRPSKSIFYKAGLFYIQEPSAMCPVEVLQPKKGDMVLDICAAPGGKSAQIAGFLQGEGLLVSNDASPSRSKALVKNLEMAGVTNAVVLTEQPKKIAARFPEFFDKILVDAPCSGEGMFRRDTNAVKAYTANKPETCAKMQKEILYYAAGLLKQGGQMVYSTFTFNTRENEEVIADFLKQNPNFKLIPIDYKKLGISQGYDKQGRTARIWPHISKGEGHFIAHLQKDGETAPQKVLLNKTAGDRFCHQHPDEKLRSNFSAYKTILPPREFSDFCKTSLNINWTKNPTLHGTSIFLQSQPLNLTKLRTARNGWYVGEKISEKNKQFTPSQALAMGLIPTQATNYVNLSEADAWRYLKGETLENTTEANEKLWILICHQNLPLGWAKLVQGRLKNQLPKGWVTT